MADEDLRVILVTGASSGIGKACADHLSERGHRVFGTSRGAPFPPELAPHGATTSIRMDVTQDASVERAVGFVLETTSRIDAVVNSAGMGIAGALEDTTIEEARSQFETNFFGALRVCKAVLPAMRSRRSGTIVNVSSIGGLIALPYQSMYSASKFALEGMTEALRVEVKPFGIHVVLVEPGDASTEFTDNRRFVARNQPDDRFKRMMDIVEADERSGTSPQAIARLVGRIIDHPSPSLRYRIGPFQQTLAAALKGVLPGWFFEWAFMTYYRLH